MDGLVGSLGLSGQRRNAFTGDLQSAVAVRLLKKANDQMQQQGEALISMIEQTGLTDANPLHLDTCA